MRPATPTGRLPLFISKRSREPDLPGHMKVPRPSASGQSHAGQPGSCAPRMPPTLTGVPAKTGPRTGSTTPALLILRCRHRLQGSLTEGQRRPCRPRDARGEGVNGRLLPHCNDGCPCAPFLYVSGSDWTPLSGLGKAPLTERAILRTGATRERRKVALQIGDADPGGQDWR